MKIYYSTLPMEPSANMHSILLLDISENSGEQKGEQNLI